MASFQPLAYTSLVEELTSINPVIINKIRASTGIQEEEKIKCLLEEVLKFLHLIHYSNQRLTPSHEVDLAWHEFILFTKYYTEFCQQYFGRYMHHHPGGLEEENDKQFRQMIKLYVLLIGTPPEEFWGPLAADMAESAFCGSCDGGN